MAAALPLVAVALALPWAFAAIQVHARPGDPSLVSGILVGLWAHLVVIAPAVALGALASRAVMRSYGSGTVVLVAGVVLSLVLGVRGSPVWWLAPPALPVARLAVHGFVLPGVATFTAQAAVWTAVALAGYARVRRLRV